MNYLATPGLSWNRQTWRIPTRLFELEDNKVYYQLMVQRLINNNIVILYVEDISSLLSTDHVEAQINSIFADKEPIPVINKFPGFSAIVVPQAQVSLILQGGNLTISDQNIGEFTSRDNAKLMTFARNVYSLVKKTCISYGFNFIIEVEDTFETISRKLSDKFFKTDLASALPSGFTPKILLPVINSEKDGVKITYKFENIVNGPTGENANRIKIAANYHFNAELPEIANLITEYKSKGLEISNYLDKLFSE